MSAGTLVRILCGMHRGKRAEVIGISGGKVTVRGSFGTAMYQASEVEVMP